MKIFALFPGQGSQKVGMGKDLYEQFPLAREMFQTANDVLGFSLSDICFEGPEEKLTMTEIVQPAILTVSSIFFQLAEDIIGSNLNIVSAAGHSLGEYSALTASGAIEFSKAVALVHHRGQYMQNAVPLGQGKMVAVLKKDLAEIEEAMKEIDGIVEIANINSPGQTVIAGEAAAVDTFMKKMADARLVELQVSAPFHCSMMEPAAKALSVDLQDLEISSSRFPVYANYSATPASSTDEIRENLINQVCGRVRWVECMNNAIAASQPDLAIEFGTGNVLTGLLKRINKDLSCETMNAAERIEELAQKIFVGAIAA